MSFDSYDLSPDLLQTIQEIGYTTPTPVQEKAIPIALQGKDVLGIAQTGTGKTAAFSFPLIERLSKGRARARMPRSLILEPTRELAAQVAENIEQYTKRHKLELALLIGGVSFTEQEKKLDRGVDILIATPGRLMDHQGRGKILMNGVEVFVVDEADRMLDMGFIPDIEHIFQMLPLTRQTLFFSATMPPEISKLTDRFLHNPERVEVARAATTAETVTQKLCVVDTMDKRKVLRHFIRSDEVTNGIIFCNMKRSVDILARSLTKHEFNVGALHGDLDQRVRMRILDEFKSGKIQLLVASDVAARGLDIPDVSHVFNFDVPTHAEDYVHRIGRTGRAGRSGCSITISTRDEAKYTEAIEKLIGKPIPIESVTGFEVTDTTDDPDGGEKKHRGRGRGRSSNDRDTRDKSKKRPKKKAEDTKSKKENREEPVVGLGDHVPAFLLRPTTLPKKDGPDNDKNGSGGASEAA